SETSAQPKMLATATSIVTPRPRRSAGRNVNVVMRRRWRQPSVAPRLDVRRAGRLVELRPVWEAVFLLVELAQLAARLQRLELRVERVAARRILLAERD